MLSLWAVPPSAKQPGPLTVKTWERAGAEFGWIHVNEFAGNPGWQPDPGDSEDTPQDGSPFNRENARAGNYSAVRFKAFPTGKIGALPEPELCIRLWLDGSGVTDDNLKEIGGLTQLQWLALYRNELSDAGLKYLTGLKELRRLALSGTHVTDKGMEELTKLKHLQMLAISSTQLTDTGLRELAAMRKLKLLDIGNTGVTDAGMKTLAGFEEMQTLYLVSLPLTDACISELAKLSKLQYVALQGTNVTEHGKDRLRKALPEARID
jgi:hypothetical protein